MSDKSENKPTAIEAINISLQALSNRIELEQKNRISQLRKMYAASKLATKFFDYLAYSKNSFKTNSVRYLQNELESDYYDLISILKELDKCNFGDFIVGRKGKESRIEWNYFSKSIGSVAAGLSPTLVGNPKKLPEYDGGGEDESLLKHTFLLRPELEVVFSLPKNFNFRDAERLTNFLKTIPFD